MSETRTLPDTGLLPCPFCGSPAYLSEFENSMDEYIVQIQCANGETCKVCVDVQSGSEEEAIAIWNTRPGPAQSAGVREALSAANLTSRDGTFVHASTDAVLAALGTAGAVEAVTHQDVMDAYANGVADGKLAHNTPPAQLAIRAAPSPAALEPSEEVINIRTASEIEAERLERKRAVKAVGLDPATVEACAKIADPWPGFWPLDEATPTDLAIIEVRKKIAAAIRASNADTSTVPTWRTIDRAPMDGTSIDVWFVLTPTHGARWANVGWNGKHWSGGPSSQYEGGWKATYWMPKPAPPNPQSQTVRGQS